jgi:hypothetical protein
MKVWLAMGPAVSAARPYLVEAYIRVQKGVRVTRANPTRVWLMIPADGDGNVVPGSVRAVENGYMESMNGYHVAPDGLVRQAGRVVADVPAVESAPSLPTIVPEILRLDTEAARRFNRIAQTPAATQLTVPPV